jgi:hypothetical protein
MNQGMEEDGEWRWREVGEEEERQRQSVAASNNGTRVRFDDKIWRAMQLRLARTMGKKKGGRARVRMPLHSLWPFTA